MICRNRERFQRFPWLRCGEGSREQGGCAGAIPATRETRWGEHASGLRIVARSASTGLARLQLLLGDVPGDRHRAEDAARHVLHERKAHLDVETAAALVQSL